MTFVNERDKLMKACLFRAQHRGSREADKVIGGFALRHLSHLSHQDLQLFADLLTWDDHEIFEWIMEDNRCAFSQLQQALRDFQQSCGSGP